MRITLTNEQGAMYNLEVSEDMDLASFKALCEVETSIPSQQINIYFEGKELNDDTAPLNSFKIKDGEVLLIKDKNAGSLPNIDFSNIIVPNSQASNSTNSYVNAGGMRLDPVALRNDYLRDPSALAVLRHNNPSMAAALEKSQEAFTAYVNEQQRLKMEEQEKLKRLLANPFDEDAQRLIAEEIRKQNVEKNMEIAMEYHPESFGQVSMLYINCKVNGHPVKAFIDSGAQVTIMSKSCAEKCEIMRLMDNRFAGTARGVGVQKISGKIHLCQIQIENDFLPTSFTILEDQDMEVMLGLDMLKRHQCCIDLKRNLLVIGTTGTETRFLSENEIPNTLAHHTNEDAQLNEAISRSIKESQSATSLAYSEDLLKEFLSMGFKREIIITYLRNFNNDREQVLAALLASSLSMP